MDAVAAVTMLIDHIGMVFFPGVLWLRIIGRLALPAYCWLCGHGAVTTRRPWQYFGRLLLIGVVAVAAWGVHGRWSVNVCFGLALGMLAMRAWFWCWWLGLLVMILGGGVLEMAGASYGALPVIAVCGFGLAGRWGWLIWCVADVAYACLANEPLQVFGLLAVLLMACEGVRFIGRRWRLAWWSYYPGHVALLGVVRAMS